MSLYLKGIFYAKLAIKYLMASFYAKLAITYLMASFYATAIGVKYITNSPLTDIHEGKILRHRVKKCFN